MRVARAGLRGMLEDAFDLMIAEPGNNGRYIDDHRNSGTAELTHSIEPSVRRRGARLHGPSQLPIKGRDRNHHKREILLGHRRKNIDIPGDHVVLGRDAEGVPKFGENLEDITRDGQAAFNRLVTVRIGAELDAPGRIARLGELLCEQSRGIGLVKKPGFEIETGREPEVSVAWARETINAAMLATPVGIDRSVESDVGALVSRQDNLRFFDRQCCSDARGRHVLAAGPAVVEFLGLYPFEAARDVRAGRAAFHAALVAFGRRFVPFRHWFLQLGAGPDFPLRHRRQPLLCIYKVLVMTPAFLPPGNTVALRADRTFRSRARCEPVAASGPATTRWRARTPRPSLLSATGSSAADRRA